MEHAGGPASEPAGGLTALPAAGASSAAAVAPGVERVLHLDAEFGGGLLRPAGTPAGRAGAGAGASDAAAASAQASQRAGAPQAQPAGAGGRGPTVPTDAWLAQGKTQVEWKALSALTRKRLRKEEAEQAKPKPGRGRSLRVR
jgi:hypothetical protein